MLLHNCFDFDIVDKPPANENYILFVGRLAATKGINTLLKAATGLNLAVYIVGDGPERLNILQYITDHKLSNIFMQGFKTKNEVYDLISKAKALICPSEWYENFPSVVIEAMSLKTPVIGARIGGIPELVVDEETGLLFEPANAADLRSNIQRLLADESLANRLSEAAFTNTFNMVNYHHHYEILKGVYANLGFNL